MAFSDWPRCSLSSFFAFKTKMLQFLSDYKIMNWTSCTYTLSIFNDSRGGLCYKPRGFLRSPHHYCKFYYSFSFYFNKANKWWWYLKFLLSKLWSLQMSSQTRGRRGQTKWQWTESMTDFEASRRFPCLSYILNSHGNGKCGMSMK